MEYSIDDDYHELEFKKEQKVEVLEWFAWDMLDLHEKFVRKF